jgi:hypothetical protein
MAKPRVPKKSGENTPEVTAPSNGFAAAEAGGNGSATNGDAAKTAARRKAMAKPEIVKTDGRANIVPINLEEEVRRLAYLMAERRGFEPGHEAEDWFAAEREVRQRYHQHSA